MNAMNPISRWVSAGIAGLASLAAFAEPPAAAPAAASARPAAMVGEFENQSMFRDPAFLRSFRTRIETEIGNTRKFVIVDRDPSAFRYRKTETDLADAGLAGANVVAPGDENLTLAGFALSGTVLHFHISPGVRVRSFPEVPLSRRYMSMKIPV